MISSHGKAEKVYDWIIKAKSYSELTQMKKQMAEMSKIINGIIYLDK